MRYLILFLWLLSSLLTAGTDAVAGDYQITLQTNDCNGDTGMLTVPVGSIYKIESFSCEASDARRKQLLIRTRRDDLVQATGSYGNSVLVRGQADSFDAVLITEKEAARVQKEIEHYMAARRKNLERGKTIILEH